MTNYDIINFPVKWEDVRKVAYNAAKRYCGRNPHLELEELLNVGRYAYFTAIKSYDKNRGTFFAHYYYACRSAMVDYIRTLRGVHPISTSGDAESGEDFHSSGDRLPMVILQDIPQTINPAKQIAFIDLLDRLEGDEKELIHSAMALLEKGTYRTIKDIQGALQRAYKGRWSQRRFYTARRAALAVLQG